jgi:molybdopterin molybdotransferase
MGIQRNQGMISFEEAQNIIFSSIRVIDTEKIPYQKALGRVLARAVTADADLPPFSRSAMDGFALRAKDQDMLLDIIDEIPAGQFPEKEINRGQCVRIMTGAPIPVGCDMVVRIEDTEIHSNGKVRIKVKGTVSNIRMQGEDVKKNENIIDAGQLIRKQHIGMMAMVGWTRPLVYRKPSVGILTTGSELVSPEEHPPRSRIRNSNGPQLSAQLAGLGIESTDYGIAPDDPVNMSERIGRIIQEQDVILISGGVSAGDYDYVPGILRKAGMDIRVHKMKVRPGKPLLFAVNGNKYVFGLPGNPVSTFVQFECMVKPFLLRLMGIRGKMS